MRFGGEANKVAFGEIVSEAGKYDMPMDWYHAQCCAGPSVSSSGLRKIYHESPADFWAYSDLNEHRFEEEKKDAFIYGRAAHALILGDEVFEDSFVVVPKTAPPKPTAAQIAARAEGRISDAAAERFDFWDSFNLDGKDELALTDLIHIEHIADRLREHDVAQILLDGEREKSLIWPDKQTGIWLKSRLDILSATGDYADFKTTHDTKQHLISASVDKRGYDMQIGLATMAVEEVLGIPFDPETYAGRAAILLFVYKKPPYHITPVEVGYQALDQARQKCRMAINTMAKCIRSQNWPGPVEGILEYQPSTFALNDFERRVERYSDAEGLY